MLLQPQGVHLALMIPSTMMIKAINGVAKAIKSDDPQEIETIKDISKVVPGNSTKTAFDNACHSESHEEYAVTSGCCGTS